MMKRTSNNVYQDSTAAKKQKFHDQVENSSSNDDNQKLAIKQNVDILEKRVETVERIVRKPVAWLFNFPKDLYPRNPKSMFEEKFWQL
uniref:Uncharacterized protein n=1 Tax=Romanomermis culicivorax TaxID=13658 RepID=A0A915KCF5_ROMCU